MGTRLFYVYCSIHRWSVSIIVQRDGTQSSLFIILQFHSKCVGCQPHPSSGILTYLLTPWCRVLLEKLTGLQLVKKFPAFHGTRKFITALAKVRHLSLSWASPILSIYPHPTAWRSILILSTHLSHQEYTKLYIKPPCNVAKLAWPSWSEVVAQNYDQYRRL